MATIGCTGCCVGCSTLDDFCWTAALAAETAKGPARAVKKVQCASPPPCCPCCAPGSLPSLGADAALLPCPRWRAAAASKAVLRRFSPAATPAELPPTTALDAAPAASAAPRMSSGSMLLCCCPAVPSLLAAAPPPSERAASSRCRCACSSCMRNSSQRHCHSSGRLSARHSGVRPACLSPAAAAEGGPAGCTGEDVSTASGKLPAPCSALCAAAAS